MSDFGPLEETEDERPPTRRWRSPTRRWRVVAPAAFIAVVVVAAMYAATLLGGGEVSTAPAPTSVMPTPTVAAPAAPAVPGLVRRADATPRPAFDFGPAPSLPSIPGFVVPTPRPTPEPAPHEKIGGFIWNLPIIGGAIQGVAAVIGAIDWMLKNIWLVIVVVLLIGGILRLPVITLLVAGWKFILAPFGKRRFQDVWEEHKDEFKDAWPGSKSKKETGK